MLANFTFKRYKDRYYLANTGTGAITYSLQRKSNCNPTYKEVAVGTVPSISEIEIMKSVEDGAYRVVLTKGSDNQTIEVKHFLRLQKELIYNTIKVLCGNKEICHDCGDLDQSQLALFNQILGYQYLIKPYTEDYCDKNCLFDKFLYQALEQNNCDLSGKIYNSLYKQLYTGNIEVDDSTLPIFASLYFSAFYYFERLLAVDVSEEVYVDQKFSWLSTSLCMRKHINCFSDIEGIFRGVSSVCNQPPTVNSVVKSFIDLEFQEGEETYQFLASDFTTGFTDPNGDQPNTVKIVYIPNRGRLYYNNTQVTADGFTFPISSVGNLKYKFLIEETNSHFDRIFFQINDTNPTPKYSNMANIQISVTEYVNKKPDVVGNNSFTLANRAVKVFTVADFTTNTTPAYHDPEGDTLNAVRIDTLPAAGVLSWNNAACTQGQIILATDIAAGLFKYTSPDQNTTASTDWDFSVRDSGSMQFAS